VTAGSATGEIIQMEEEVPRLPLSDLDARIKKLEDQVKHPEKDAWDKLGAISTLTSGILVALIGFYATNLYDRNSKQAEETDRRRGLIAVELQTVEKFFPHLVSKDETERQGAIQLISTLANPDIAAKVAQVFGGPGARAALTKIAAESSEAQSRVKNVLVDLFRDFSPSTAQIDLVCGTEAGSLTRIIGNASIVTKDGFALTSGHLFENDCKKDTLAINFLRRDQPPLRAALVKRDESSDLALIKLPEGIYKPIKMAADPLREADAVTVLGYPSYYDDALSAVASTVLAIVQNGRRVGLSGSLSPGLSGAPMINSHGETVGIFLESQEAEGVGVPIQEARPLLALAGLS
jgi:S1-C subfamily serine protease